MNVKKESRLRRARRSRAKMREIGTARLCVNRTPRHIYAQIVTADGATVLAAASTVEKDMREGATGNIESYLRANRNCRWRYSSCCSFYS